MKDKKIALQEINVDQDKKHQALEQLQEIVLEKQICYRPSLLHVTAGQMKYLSLTAVGGQLACLVFIMVLCGYLEKSRAELVVWLGTSSVLASCLGMFLMIELCRTASYHMLELEQSCYLNVKQLWCVKMIIFGCLDLLLMSALIAGVSRNVSCGMIPLMLYLLVPFVISSGLQLLVFTMFRSGKREHLQMGAAVFISFLSLLPVGNPWLYTMACLWVWALAFLLGVGFLTVEIRLLYHMLGSGEGMCVE